MFIFIEGIDGSGKSTLASRLSASTGAPIVHMSYPKTKEEREGMFNMYCKELTHPSTSSVNRIFDRCWYSEIAYGPVMRRKSYIDYEQMYELEHIANSCGGAMVIYVQRTLQEVVEAARRRGEDYVKDPQQYVDIIKNYSALFSMPHFIPVSIMQDTCSNTVRDLLW